MTGNSCPKILPKLKKKVHLKINDFSKKICVLSILFRGTPPPRRFHCQRGFHRCDLTVGIYLTGGPALWDGDTIKMPGMQVRHMVPPVVEGFGEFQGVRFFRVFTQAKEKRRVLGFRGVSPSL